MKNVYFVYEPTAQPYGGVNSFNRALMNEMSARPDAGFERVLDWRQADLIFLSAASRGPDAAGRDRTLRPWQLNNLLSQRAFYHPFGFLRRGQNILPMIHRLDGLTMRYGRIDGAGYDDLQIELNRCAKRTVFQSRFCLESFRGSSALATDTVISNGADGTLFQGSQKLPLNDTLKFIACNWSSNPSKGHAGYAALSELPFVDVTYIGQWPKSIPLKNVKHLQAMAHQELVRYYQGADAFVHLASYDPAPNVVMEALATGLPVLYLDSGGTAEIVGNLYGVGIPNLERDSLQKGTDLLRSHIKDLQQSVAEDRDQFLMSTAYKHYVGVFQSIV
jgi:glycosyltransferase involved in cell wall biosynthesis